MPLSRLRWLRDGCTEAILLAHGFTIPLMVELVRAGLASATAERVVAGKRKIEVARVRITEAGRRVIRLGVGAMWPWGSRKRADIPQEIRDELESHGETAIQVALSIRHERRPHALAWLAEKREEAERRHRFIVVGIWAGIIAAIASAIAAWPIVRGWLN
jgi:hypothetical protein